MFNKLFTKILDSSIWLEKSSTRIVWITLIAAMDEDGYAHFAAIENLASRARVSVREAEAAVACLVAPDPNSSNPANEGRRIERVPGGFMILNAPAHRSVLSRVVQREQTRLRVKKHRELKGSTSLCNGVTLPTPLQSVTPASECVSVQERKSAEKENPLVQLGQLSALYKRKRNQFSYGEESVFSELSSRSDFVDELASILAYRQSLPSKDVRYFPQSLLRLLSNWDEVLDRVNGQAEIEPKSAMERDIERLCK